MSADWEQDCKHFWGKVLEGEDRHWCHDFDGLPIDNTCYEYQFCTCRGEKAEYKGPVYDAR